MDLINKIADTVKSSVEKVKTSLSGTNAAAQTSLPDVATAKAPSALGTAPETPGYTATGGRRIKRSRSHKKTRRGGGGNYEYLPTKIRRPSPKPSPPASDSDKVSYAPTQVRKLRGGRRTRRGGNLGDYLPRRFRPTEPKTLFQPTQIRKPKGGRRTQRKH